MSLAIMVPMTNEVRCPGSGSEHYHLHNKGFSLVKAALGDVLLGPVGLLGGLHGSKKVILTCLNCGRNWNPGGK
jgi:hypothetical protein